MCWQRVEEARCRRRLQSPSETEWPSVFSEVPFRMSASPTFLVATLAALLLASPTPVLSGRVAQLPPLAPAKSSVAPSVATSLAPTRVTLRVSSSQHKVHPSLRSSVVAIEVDHARLEVFAQLGGGLLDDVPLPSRQTVTLELLPMTPFESDAVIEAVTTPTAKSKGLARTSIDAAGTYLWGSVAGADGSRAFLASTDAGTYGFMELDGHTYIISSGPYGSNLPTVCYDLTTLPEGAMSPPSWTCSTPDELPADQPASSDANDGGVAGSTPCRQVRVAYDTDHEFLQLFGGSTSAAAGYVGTLASALTAIYSRDLNVRLSASYLRLWPESADPWTSIGTTEQLGQFKTTWDATMVPVGRDLAHMLSGRSLGGGVAYLPGLCNGVGQGGNTNAGYGLSANLLGFFPTPLIDNNSQNWDIFVIAHELGHNFGAVHTHADVPPIDGCGSSPQDCAAADLDQGTIMSYCHLCPGGLANNKLQFHPQTIAQIEARLSSIVCDYTGAARNPVAVADAGLTYTTLSIVLDVLANDAEFNCEEITLGIFPATTFYGGTLSRSVGTGSNGRDELIYTMSNPAFVEVDTFSYQVVDGSSQTALGIVSVTVEPLRQPENPSATSPKLNVSYYALASPTALPAFGALTPYLQSTALNLAFASTASTFGDSGRSDNVGAVFEGWINVPSSGGWTFSLNSDEGSRLLIGDTLVVSNDGLHGMTEQSGTIGLSAGRHAIRVEYFERNGNAGLIASWAGPLTAKVTIPSSAFSRGGSDWAADFDNDARVGASDLALLLSVWNSPSETYDLTGDGMVNAQDLATLLFAWTE